jgi:hypothetical protein
MSIFKIIKNNSELFSTMLDTKANLSDNSNIFNTNTQSMFLSKNIEKNVQNFNTTQKSYSRKDINIFYSKIKLIRKKYSIKKSRKNNIDSLVKKVKSKFLKAIYECLKFCLNSFINRLPQRFIINTKIDYNKKFLCKTLEEIYIEFKLLPNYETLLEKNMIQKGKEHFLYILYKSKVKDIYKEYLKSDFYSNEKYEIEKKNGFGVAKLYDFVAMNICEYFLFNKGNDKRISLSHHKNKEKNSFGGAHKIVNNNFFVKFNILKIDNIVNQDDKEKKSGK